MLDGTTGGGGGLDDPLAILFLQGVGDLHSGAVWGAGLGFEFDLGLGLVALNGDTGDVHVHGAEVDGFQGSQVLVDAGADGIGIAFLLFAAGEEGQKGDEG